MVHTLRSMPPYVPQGVYTSQACLPTYLRVVYTSQACLPTMPNSGVYLSSMPPYHAQQWCIPPYYASLRGVYPELYLPTMPP